jgi:hypothetical protein
VFTVDRRGPRLAFRRTATAEEGAALSRGAKLTVERLAERGLVARIVSERLDRRTIDLILESGWEDPPKARIAELLAAVEDRLAAAGIAGLPEAVMIAQAAAGEAPLADARGGPQLAGHTALEVVTRLPKPVVVVPPHAQPPKQLARILVPLDGSSETSRALKAAIEFAHRRELEILVLHIHSAATVPAFADHEPHATWAWD